MRVIIAGSRTLCSRASTLQAIKEAQAAGFNITEVVCGMATGPDTYGKEWAEAQDPPIPVTSMPADWIRFGTGKAGKYRNIEMGVYARTGPEGGGLILVYDGESSGSAHMLKIAKNFGLKIFVKTVHCVGNPPTS